MPMTRLVAPRTSVFWLAWLVGLALAGGCGEHGHQPSKPQGQASRSTASGITGDELFKLGLENLENAEQYRSAEMLEQVIERFNQWARLQAPLPNWKPDPLLDGLAPAYRELPAVQELDKLVFPRDDAFTLLAAVWVRDLSKWARGTSPDELDRAARLFDWTVRNIQLQPTVLGPDGRPVVRPRQFPWETLLVGHGTPLDRAWVFILLARQQQIDAALVSLTPPGETDKGRAVPWAVGVLVGGEIYVFDPALGIPIPGPDGVKLAAGGPLDIRPATLKQLAGDPALLRRLDLDGDRRYAVSAGDLARAVAEVEASPSELSMRMKMLEDRMAGPKRMTLAVDASAQADRFLKAGAVGDARLWTRPFSVLEQRVERVHLEEFDLQMPVWRGRIAHLRGNFTGERGATHFYQMARPPDAEIDALVADGKLPPALRPFVTRAKSDASFWLGLLSYDLGHLPAAIDYFQKWTLDATPGGPWTYAARFNLGRAYEAAGQYEQAIAQYEKDRESPGYHGMALRATWLRELSPKQVVPPKPAMAEPAPSPKAG